MSGLLALMLAITLASCATTPPPPPVQAPPQLNPQQEFDRGDYAEAARQWQQQALQASEDQADKLRISAANAWLLANDPGRAESLMRWINKDQLNPADRSRLEIVQADLAYRSGYYDEAASLLRNAETTLPDSSASRFQGLQMQVRTALEQVSTVDLGAIQQQVAGQQAYEPNQALATLQSMDSIPSAELAALAATPRADTNLTAWLELALLIRQNLVVPDQLEKSVFEWKLTNSDFYLAETDALDLWLNYRQEFKAPGKVAVLLPESGRLQAAANAMRDGLMSAFANQPGSSQIVFISSGEDPASIPAAYFDARDQGADFIIGPIQTEAIEALLQLSDLRTPVLALNDLPADFRAPLGLADEIHGVSLSQDAELRATARAMAESGFSRAMVLAPESEWGERVVRVFTEEFLQDERQIVVSGRFLESENDHSAAIERMLQLDESNARRRQLETTLQMALEFEPVRRDDIDVIFLAANPSQGRQIKPQLRFYNAGDIPVYASSRIYSGRPDRTADQDLNGVRFASMPLQIETAGMRKQTLPASLKGGNFTPLFALGNDAWNILPFLELMKKDPDFSFPGQSGLYKANLGGNLERSPIMAEFRYGIPATFLSESKSPPAGSDEQ